MKWTTTLGRRDFFIRAFLVLFNRILWLRINWNVCSTLFLGCGFVILKACNCSTCHCCCSKINSTSSSNANGSITESVWTSLMMVSTLSDTRPMASGFYFIFSLLYFFKILCFSTTNFPIIRRNTSYKIFLFFFINLFQKYCEWFAVCNEFICHSWRTLDGWFKGI